MLSKVDEHSNRGGDEDDASTTKTGDDSCTFTVSSNSSTVLRCLAVVGFTVLLDLGTAITGSGFGAGDLLDDTFSSGTSIAIAKRIELRSFESLGRIAADFSSRSSAESS